MLPVVPYKLEEIKNELKQKAIKEFGLLDAEFEGSNVSQLINLLAYSTLVNNTNLTYGLNEMFITQATDRKNIIKHARQMGYTHKRKLSYQYKIKLKTIKEGTLTLPKYTNFTSNGNNYVYLDEDITDTYGTNITVNNLKNEYNNGAGDLYSKILLDSKIISEDGVVGTVLNKSQTGEDRMLLKSDSGELFQPFSKTLTQNIYVEVTDASGNPQALNSNVPYRDFVKVGTVDTFLKDKKTEMFKVQITLENDISFPIYTEVNYTTTVLNNKLVGTTSKPIKFVTEIILSKLGANDIIVDVNSLKYIQDNSTFTNNVLFPSEAINASELKAIGSGSYNNLDYIITANENILEREDCNVVIDFGNGSTKTISKGDLSINYTSNEITITPVNIPKTYTNDNSLGDAINNGIINVGGNISSVNTIVVINASGERTEILDYTFSTSNITIKDINGNTDISFDNGYSIEVDYVKRENLESYPITINYSYLINLDNYSANITYAYDKGEDGYLDRRFYFSDLRGIYPENETPSGPQGWQGFYASDFDEETNVLYFDVSQKTDGTFHNEYVKTRDPNTGALKTALPLYKVMVTPFRKTRFFYAKFDENLGEYIPDGNSCFASVENLSRKNEVELIVKEGTMKRYSDTDENGNVLYPELTVAINSSMVKAGYFTVFAPNLEHNGIELFVTRIMPDGSIEYDMPWNQRDYLLAEHTNVNQSAPPVPNDYGLTVEGVKTGITNDEYDAALAIWQRQRVKETFTVMSDLNYEDYINIYTKYAGTGVALTQDMIIKMNILDSSGSKGAAGDLISPVGSNEFEAKYYIDKSFTPYIMHAEGTDQEGTESIRKHAPEFSNTSNRAVTKTDYKTICEAQPFIASAQVWGGEEVPKLRKPNDNGFFDKILGNIYFSIIPYSKPYTFSKELNVYSLDNIYENKLFFPTYTQITGKESYTELNNNMKNNKNILFSILENYKILTLNLNYEKVVYMDIKVNVDVLKYKFGQTIIETNKEIFKSVKTFMIKEIEKFDSTFYLSSLVKHIDTNLGDSYGLIANMNFSTDLYDSYNTPELGTFKNITNKSLVTPNKKIQSPTYKGINYPGYNDDWVFEMPIAMPIQDLFASDFVTEAGIIERGNINLDNITNIDTDNFIEPGDKLYMPLFSEDLTGKIVQDTGSFKSYNRDLIYTGNRPTSASEVIEIPIFYQIGYNKTLNDGINSFNLTPGKIFKVGTYTISKSDNIIMLRINTHSKNNILNPRIYLNSNTQDPDTYNPVISGNIYKAPFTYTNIKGDTIEVIEAALPRDYFMNTIRTININSKDQNISVIRNTYPRLKSVEFTTK